MQTFFGRKEQASLPICKCFLASRCSAGLTASAKVAGQTQVLEPVPDVDVVGEKGPAVRSRSPEIKKGVVKEKKGGQRNI